MPWICQSCGKYQGGYPPSVFSKETGEFLRYDHICVECKKADSMTNSVAESTNTDVNPNKTGGR